MKMKFRSLTFIFVFLFVNLILIFTSITSNQWWIIKIRDQNCLINNEECKVFIDTSENDSNIIKFGQWFACRYNSNNNNSYHQSSIIGFIKRLDLFILENSIADNTCYYYINNKKQHNISIYNNKNEDLLFEINKEPSNIYIIQLLSIFGSISIFLNMIVIIILMFHHLKMNKTKTKGKFNL
jgi:hypothetical protein